MNLHLNLIRLPPSLLLSEPENLGHYILDPLSVIIKLAILNIKPVGTKLVVNNNAIYFQEPGIFQAMCRFIVHAAKTDLTYLNIPIHVACQQFITDECIALHPSIILLFSEAQKGLLRLAETYKYNDIVRIALHHYVAIITSYLTRNPEQTLSLMHDKMSPLYPDRIRHRLYHIWSAEQIRNILNIITYLVKAPNASQDVAGLETFMISIDNAVHIMLLDATAGTKPLRQYM